MLRRYLLLHEFYNLIPSSINMIRALVATRSFEFSLLCIHIIADGLSRRREQRLVVFLRQTIHDFIKGIILNVLSLEGVGFC
jgi:hypothetical protein